MKIRRRLSGRGGFTLAETLLAVLILLLVSVIVANGVPVARNVYQKVVLTANAQDIMATAVSALRDELGTAWDVAVNDVRGQASGTFLTYYSADTGARSKLSAEGSPAQIMLQENVGVAGLGVTDNADSVARPLVSDKESAGKSRLYVTYQSVSYDKDRGTVTFTNLRAGTESKPDLVKVDTLSIHVFSGHEG